MVYEKIRETCKPARASFKKHFKFFRAGIRREKRQKIYYKEPILTVFSAGKSYNTAVSEKSTYYVKTVTQPDIRVVT